MQWLIDIVVAICKAYTDQQFQIAKDYTDHEIEGMVIYTDNKIALLKSYTDDLFATFNSVPSKTVMAWYGLRANIPDGWQACNGANGTPDLRDRFIYGCGPGVALDQVGGSETHIHEAGVGLTDGKAITNTGSSLPPYRGLWYIMKM